MHPILAEAILAEASAHGDPSVGTVAEHGLAERQALDAVHISLAERRSTDVESLANMHGEKSSEALPADQLQPDRIPSGSGCQQSGSYARTAAESVDVDDESESEPDTMRSPPVWDVEPPPSVPAPPAPGPGEVRVLLDSAWAAVDRGAVEQARQQLGALLKLAPRMPEVHILGAVVEEADGRVFEALQALRSALLLDPSSAEAQLRSSLLLMRALESELHPRSQRTMPSEGEAEAHLSGARRLIRFERARRGRG